MDAQRKTIINGFKIEEYYWHGKFVVYIDNKLSDYDYETVCKQKAINPTSTARPYQ